jgi:hypothetical protein
MSLLIPEDIDINNIKLDDIPCDMPMYAFIGKTIEKLLYKGENIEIKFTDGTCGLISNGFPIMYYGRDTYNKHREKGELNLFGHHSDDPGYFKIN